jgi:hypothetical protein
MARRLAGLAVALWWLVAALGCASRRGMPPDLGAHPRIVRGAVLAWAWGGAAGFEGKDGYPVRVLYQPLDEAERYGLFFCDPASSPCTDLVHFGDLGLRPRPYAGGLLGEFRTGIDEADCVLLVIAERGGELLTSDLIAATPVSRPTGYAAGGIRFDRRQQEFAWPRVPDADLYVLTVRDEGEKDAPVGIATRRKSWAYPELQGIARYFHDPAAVPKLRPGLRYRAVLFALDPRHWATLITDLDFAP